MSIFTALLVTSGISTFGLASQLVPLVAGPWNPEWNNAQSGWKEDVLDHLNPSLFLSAPDSATPEQKAQALENIRTFRQGVQPVDENGKIIPKPAESDSLGTKVHYWRAVFWQVPWSAWMKPLAGWLVFVAAVYGMFYSLTYVAAGLLGATGEVDLPVGAITRTVAAR